MRKGYLFFYNLVQFAGWSYGFIRFIQHIQKGSHEGSWNAVSNIITFFQTLQSLEVLHCVVGLVPSNAIQTAMQIASRLIIVWGILLPVVEARDSIGVPLLLFAWSIAEATRYIYYALNIYDKVPGFLTWCRYSFFILLYPIGVSGELISIVAALPYIIRHSLFAIALPNPLNVSFYYEYLLYGVMASYIPFFPQLYFYMLNQRKKFLGSDPAKKAK